ncbi:conserved hypothetical protein, partial [Streptomyces pristinaespiralis ATCC 25486]
MEFMGDRATLLETGRFVQPHAGDVADAIDVAVRVDHMGKDRNVTSHDNTDDNSADTVETAGAEARHRSAADAGDTAAMSVLGALLLRRGDLDGAEPYLRGATADGDRAAANNLGVLLHQRGYADEAAGWWRIAAVAGSAAAAHALGRHFHERGDEPAAEYWLRQSAEQGHALGAYALADLLEHRSDVGAERWLRTAAEQGHREAAYRLARALERRAAEECRKTDGVGRLVGTGPVETGAARDAVRRARRGEDGARPVGVPKGGAGRPGRRDEPGPGAVGPTDP